MLLLDRVSPISIIQCPVHNKICIRIVSMQTHKIICKGADKLSSLKLVNVNRLKFKNGFKKNQKSSSVPIKCRERIQSGEREKKATDLIHSNACRPDNEGTIHPRPTSESFSFFKREKGLKDPPLDNESLVFSFDLAITLASWCIAFA